MQTVRHVHGLARFKHKYVTKNETISSDAWIIRREELNCGRVWQRHVVLKMETAKPKKTQSGGTLGRGFGHYINTRPTVPACQSRSPRRKPCPAARRGARRGARVRSPPKASRSPPTTRSPSLGAPPRSPEPAEEPADPGKTIGRLPDEVGCLSPPVK